VIIMKPARHQRAVAPQAPTEMVTTLTIMRDREFALGFDDARVGRPFNPPGDSSWGYERGRLLAYLAPPTLPLKVGGQINPAALRLCDAAFDRSYLI
jgi:hypothetical protein